MDAAMSKARNHDRNRILARCSDDLRDLHHMCREGRLYEVQDWIADGKPFQLAPDVIRKGTRPKTALEIALRTGQHSLALLLLKSGYQLTLEQYSVLDLALKVRRWDLFDLLLEWGADMMSTDAYMVLDSYNSDLYERFRAAGYPVCQRS